MLLYTPNESIYVLAFSIVQFNNCKLTFFFMYKIEYIEIIMLKKERLDHAYSIFRLKLLMIPKWHASVYNGVTILSSINGSYDFGCNIHLIFILIV